MPSLCLKNGKKRWRGSVMVNGKASRRWFPDATKDSERAAASWEAEEKKNLETQTTKTTPTTSWTVRTWGNAAMAHSEQTHSPATLREKRTTYKMLARSLGPDFPLGELTLDMAEEHLDSQEETRSGNAANKDRKNLSADWQWAARKFRREGFPAVNPWGALARYAETRRPRYVPPMEDMRTVLAFAQGQDKAMLVVLLNLAARVREVFRLTWTDIDFARGRVRLKTRKTDDGSWREDWLPMTKECRAALMAQWERRAPGQEAVFAQEGNFNLDAPLRGQAFTSRQHFMRKICERSGVRPFGFHAIRHLTAGALYEAGYPVSTIQRVLRHQSPSTTTIYLRNHGYNVERLESALEDALKEVGL